MRFSSRFPPQVLTGALFMLFIILGALWLARHLLWEAPSNPPSGGNPAKAPTGPPLLPSIIVEPKALIKEPPEPIQASDDLASKVETPAGTQDAPLRLEQFSPTSGKVRVLPPIQAEPGEEAVDEPPFEFVAEPMEEESPEDESAPLPTAPEPGPDFVR